MRNSIGMLTLSLFFLVGLILDLVSHAQEAQKKVYVCPPCGVDCHDDKYVEPGTCPACGMYLVVEREASPAAPPRYEIDTTDVLINSDGVQLGASYYVPQGLSEPLPAVVVVHGSAPSTRNGVGFFSQI